MNREKLNNFIAREKMFIDIYKQIDRILRDVEVENKNISINKAMRRLNLLYQEFKDKIENGEFMDKKGEVSFEDLMAIHTVKYMKYFIEDILEFLRDYMYVLKKGNLSKNDNRLKDILIKYYDYENDVILENLKSVKGESRKRKKILWKSILEENMDKYRKRKLRILEDNISFHTNMIEQYSEF
ncbi:MAG: hypothetical protein QW336_00965 [Candidatus Anstonellales archaeon]